MKDLTIKLNFIKFVFHLFINLKKRSISMAEQPKKRPPKQSTINFLLSQYGCLKAGIPGITLETVIAQIQYGNYFLYKKEVEEIIDEQTAKSDDFDAELFVEILTEANAVKTGATPRLTDNLVRINSKERALQVANNPASEDDVNMIMSVMTEIKDLADKLSPLINEHATISIALKNKRKENPIPSNVEKVEDDEEEEDDD